MADSDRTDHNHNLAALAEVAAKVLWNNPKMPTIVGVDIGTSSIGGQGLRTMVALHLTSGTATPAAAMAEWARAFGDSVHYGDRGRYLESWTETVVDGATVVVWDHVDLNRVFAIRDLLGAKSFDEMADVHPDRLLGGDL